MPIKSSRKVAFSSGWVTWAFLKRSAAGRTNRSNLGGFLVNDSPTKVTLFTCRFHCFFWRLPDFITLKTCG